jgi:thymidylate kinase
VIVALTGVDAAGKNSQSLALADVFRDQGVFSEVKVFDFPHYQSIAGGVIGRVLRGGLLVVPAEEADTEANDQARDAAHWGDWDGWTLVSKLAKSWSLDKGYVIQSLMLADRLEHIVMLKTFAADPKKLLILDRYYLDAYVYGQADGLSLEWLEITHSVLPRADVSFLLDIPVEESIRRRPERRDYYERNTAKLERVREIYLSEFRWRQRNAHEGAFYIIDGLRSKEVVTFEIASTVAITL